MRRLNTVPRCASKFYLRSPGGRRKKPFYFCRRVGQFRRVKSLIQFTALVAFFGGLVFSTNAGFSNIYIWGDTLSTTTTNGVTGSQTTLYYGGKLRFSNGRTWVEVMAQRQGLGANSITNANWDYSSNNLSYYYHLSSNVVTDLKTFNAPANASNCLFVVWVANADFVAGMLTYGKPDSGTNIGTWTTNINLNLTNHFNIITNLYAKGCRTLVAPNAADVTTTPQFNGSGAAYRAFVRQRIISFNTNYAAMLKQFSTNTNYPGLTICAPDIFSLLDDVETNAATYGLTNALNTSGQISSVLATASLSPWALNGPGTNYIFWDSVGDPTAKMGEVIADTVQQSLSPVQFSGLTQVGSSNRLDVVNMPIGMSGSVQSATNLTQANWLTNSPGFTGTNVVQSVFVPASGAQNFYRLQFPWQWTWP